MASNRKTRNDVRKQATRLGETLQKAALPELPPHRAVLRRLGPALDAFYGEARERAGYQRIPKKAIGEAHRTFRHLVCAVGHAQEHFDGNVRKDARKLLKSTTHPGMSFENLSRRASKHAGLVLKAGRRRADEEREASVQPVNIDPRHRLEELTSKRKLRATGKALGNCLSGGEFLAAYWSEVKGGTAEFWVLHKKSNDGWKPHGLFHVNTTGPREIVDCKGPKNRLLKLKRKVAEAVLRALRASGDDVETFTRVGAFTALLNDRPKVEPFHVGQRRIRVWCYPEEIILKVRHRPGGKSTWSRLYRWDDTWLGDDEALVGILADLLLAHALASENRFPAPEA